MATIELTKDNFVDTINKNEITLVDLWAAWCGPCQRFGPIFEAASERHKDVVFAKLDTEQEQELSAALEVTAIPTLMMFKQGVLIFRQAGLMRGSDLDQLVKQAKELDIEAALKEAEEQAGKE